MTALPPRAAPGAAPGAVPGAAPGAAPGAVPGATHGARRRGAERGVVMLLATLIAFQPLSTDLYLPSLPSIAAELGVDAGAVQSTLSAYILAFALTQLLAGPLSDRFGRRPVALGGIASYVAGSLLAASAGSLALLIAGRLLQAVGTCCTVVCARAIVRDRYDPATGARRLSQAMSWVALVPLVAPVAGGLVAGHLGWRATFATMAAFGLAAAFVCTRGLRESNRSPDPLAIRPGPMLANYAAVLRSRTWLGFTLVGTAMYWGLFAFLAESAFVIGAVHGLSPAAFGLALSAVTGGFLLGTLSVRRVLPRLGVQRTLSLATGLAAASGCAMLALALAGVEHVAAILVPQCAFVFAHGLSQAAWQAGSIAPFPRTAGAAAAMTGFVQNATAACAGALIGWLHDGSATPLAAMVCSAGLAAALVARTLVRRHGGVDAPARG
jgi:DHA1 family bicyclomycin/chloramphenicol resistance-like MFS transporter